MSREEAIELLDNLIGMVEDNHNSNYDTALQMAIKALEQEPCEDCVRRQAVLDSAVFANIKGANEGGYITRRIILADEVKELPSVTPKYSDAEIDRAQAVEQAYVDKMVELSVDRVLDKISAEIVDMRSKKNCSCSDCLDIIDNYKAESEGLK